MLPVRLRLCNADTQAQSWQQPWGLKPAGAVARGTGDAAEPEEAKGPLAEGTAGPGCGNSLRADSMGGPHPQPAPSWQLVPLWGPSVKASDVTSHVKCVFYVSQLTLKTLFNQMSPQATRVHL